MTDLTELPLLDTHYIKGISTESQLLLVWTARGSLGNLGVGSQYESLTDLLRTWNYSPPPRLPHWVELHPSLQVILARAWSGCHTPNGIDKHKALQAYTGFLLKKQQQKKNQSKTDIRGKHFYKTANTWNTAPLTNSLFPWESLQVFCAWKEFSSPPRYTFPGSFAGRPLQGNFISS